MVHMNAVRLLAALVPPLAVACSPVEDWRQVRPAGLGVQALFPCKPTSQTRRLALAGQPVEMTLLACRAGDTTYALSHADVIDPARVGPSLQALTAAAASNLATATGEGRAWHVDGMTPNPHSQRMRLEGRLPDGSAVREDLVTFAKGTHVYQATVIGPAPAEESVNVYFDNLKLPS